MIFVGIDGEETKDGRYVILCSSSSPPLINPDGIPTLDAFKFLVAQQEPLAELVCFGLGYDVNHWLRDVPQSFLRELWATGYMVWRGWRVEWLPGRWFKLKHRDSSRWATVQEAYGFHHSSFIDALAHWRVEDPGIIATWKRQRGTFRDSQIQRIAIYCKAECDLLVKTMQRVYTATLLLDCTPWPHTWVGAGAMAGTLLRRNNVEAHHAHDAMLTTPSGVEAIMTAYLGARIELLRQGVYTQVEAWDIRSAYPSAIKSLPSLRGARLVPARWRRGVLHGVFPASWVKLPGQVMPLPVRCGDAMYWPRTGSGWYHACELRAAVDAGYPLTIGRGYELRYSPAARREAPNGLYPFGWVHHAYDARRRLEAAGDPAASLAKLALNSVYGKFAQGQTTLPRDLPRWQSYFWAGEITARTRARILPMLLRADRPMMVQTDGVYASFIQSTSPAGGAGLGAWRRESLDWLFSVQNGVYTARQGGVDKKRAAGFFSKDIDYDAILDGWVHDGADYVHRYTSRRFIGLGTALQREQPASWRRWLDEPQSIFLRPRRKSSRWEDDGSGVALMPVMTAPGPSEPYNRRPVVLDSAPEPMERDPSEQGMEQPLRERI